MLAPAARPKAPQIKSISTVARSIHAASAASMRLAPLSCRAEEPQSGNVNSRSTLSSPSRRAFSTSRPHSSKLSPALKEALAVHHDPKPAPPAAQLLALFDKLDAEASSQTYGRSAWVTLASSALFTLNSPNAVVHLWKYIQQHCKSESERVYCASLIREVGLKTIALTGIARIINQLGVVADAFGPEIQAKLSKEPTRKMTPESVHAVQDRGSALWEDIYQPHHEKLLKKLGTYHPDLPVHIMESHYGPLLSNPSDSELHPANRVLTSVLAVASLRAQRGVGPQVTSHIYGLRKAQDAGWLGTDEGCMWVLQSIDAVADLVQAEARASKL